MNVGRWARRFGVSLLALQALSACSNGRSSVGSEDEAGGGAGPGDGFTVAVTVAGLAGTGLVLENNGGTLAIPSNGQATFRNRVPNGGGYNVIVRTQPGNPAQNCTVTNGSGTIANANVDNVQVSCTNAPPTSFGVGGTVSGLSGTGLVLRNNNTDDLSVPANGAFEFATPVQRSGRYEVTVATQPTNPTQTCSIVGGAGTAVDGDVSNVAVVCSSAAHRVGGRVTGLAGGSTLILELDGQRVEVRDNVQYQFPTALASGTAYNATVGLSANSPDQACTLANFTGTVANAEVTNINVNCVANRQLVKIQPRALQGRDLVLTLNSGNDRPLPGGERPAQFETALASGTAYNVQVDSQPSNPWQECVVSSPQGTVGDSDVTITVGCSTKSFLVGGRIEGLANLTTPGAGVVLVNNGGNELTLTSNGNFTFSEPVLSGQMYSVEVRTLPSDPVQDCIVSQGEGRVGGGDVTSVVVRCTTRTFSLGGSVSGLLGDRLVLRVNGNNRVEVQPPGGAFTFPTPLASGSEYAVEVERAPANPTQSCEIGNRQGRITNANVTNLAVTCTTSSFAVSARVTGLQGRGLVLRNNNEDSPVIPADGTYTFNTAVVSGGTYNVSVVTQPSEPTQACTVASATGTVTNGPVTVNVSCVRTQFTVSGTVRGLTGAGLGLQLNGGAPFAIAAASGADVPFTAPGSLTTGSPYVISVASEPTNPWQACRVENEAGTIGTSDVTNVGVICENRLFSVGGQVTNAGLFLQLQLSDGQVETLYGTRAFTFTNPVPSGTTYNVTIIAQPVFPPQNCTLVNGSGTVGGENVTSIQVTC